MISSSSARRPCSRRSTNRRDPLGDDGVPALRPPAESERAPRSAARRPSKRPSISASIGPRRCRCASAGRAGAARRPGAPSASTLDLDARADRPAAHADVEAVLVAPRRLRLLVADLHRASGDRAPPTTRIARWRRRRVPPSPPGTRRARTPASRDRRSVAPSRAPPRRAATRRSRRAFVADGGRESREQRHRARGCRPCPPPSSARSRSGTSAESLPARAHANLPP